MKDKIIIRLSEEEKILQSYWADVVEHIKKDLAYIWTDEVKRDFESIKKEVGRIAFVLRRLHTHYKTNKEKYNKEISDIRNLLRHLNKIQAKAEYIKQIQMDLQQIIADIEEEKIIGENLGTKLSRRGFLRFAGRTAKAAGVVLAASKIPFLLSSAGAAESKKYLSYEELMKLVNKYSYIYYSSNIKSGQVPRIILFGEIHYTDKKKILDEFFSLVDKQGKNLVFLFEGGSKGFEYRYGKFYPISSKAQYFDVDTYRTEERELIDSGNSFAIDLLHAFTNEATEKSIQIWKNPSSVGYTLLKIFNIDLPKTTYITKLQETLLNKIKSIEKEQDEYMEKRDQTMMRNTIEYIRKFPNYQFFLLVGASHVDTYNDRVKENDRFSLFFNQNKISYFSILEVDVATLVEKEKKSYESFLKSIKFDRFTETYDFFRRNFCILNNCDERLFFKLAEESK